MENKKTIGLYFVIAIVMILVLVYLSFVGFKIINKAVNPEVVSFDVSEKFSLDSINEEFAGSEVTPVGTEERSLEPPLLSLVEEKEEEEVKGGRIMGISAYNLVESQCDGSPLIGAFGDNLMELSEQGIQVCASNAFPKDTKLYIQGFGECVVRDRMNSRYRNHVDICMNMDIERALNFGRRNLKVKIIK